MSTWRRRRSRRGSALWLAVLVVLFLVFVLAPRAGTFLLVSDEAAPSDATFLTYGVSIRRTALDTAIERYRSGEGPYVLVGALNSRDATYYIVPHSSELARQYLVNGGIPDASIEVLASVSSEREEGQRLREAVANRDWERIIAYGPDFRARRTYGVLRHALAGTGVEVRVVAVPDPEVRLEKWWETRPGLNVIYNEYPRLAYYFVRGWL
jgi:hypothetical protein